MPTVSLATEYREVQASEILKQIENGEDVNLTGCHIIGELNLSEIELETVPNPKYSELLESGDLDEEDLESVVNVVNKDLMVVESNITIYNSIFDNDLDLSNTLFKKSLYFVEVDFSSSANFISTFFGDDVNFEWASFGNDANFEWASFGDGAGFWDASFGDNANFWGTSFGYDAGFLEASFGDEANFGWASFGDGAYFGGTSFGDGAYFGWASFDDNAGFWGANFGDDVGFWNASFGDDVGFSDSNFGDGAHFRGASFGDGANFERAIFGDYANFEGAIFGNDANFERASFGDYADFEDASFGNDTTFEWAIFADTAYFSDIEFMGVSLKNTNFNEMWVNWDSLENSLVFDGQTYVKLIQNFRNLEQFDDADAAYFQYRKIRQEEKSWIPFSKEGSKWSDIVMCFTCGYGVKPFRAFGLGGFIILLFSFIYRGWPTISWCNLRNTDRTQKSVVKTLLSLIPKINWSYPGISRSSDRDGFAQKVTFWDGFYFSMGTFSTIGYGDWYPKDNFRKWVMLEGFLGWLTLGLFLVTLTNVTIRP
jgi:hypothetical protein